jgi:ribosomal protein S8
MELPKQIAYANALSQIKNAVQLAHEWASYEKSPLTYSHLETVLEMGHEFECDFAGHDPIENLNSYT